MLHTEQTNVGQATHFLTARHAFPDSTPLSTMLLRGWGRYGQLDASELHSLCV
jgi:hypothetical protein